MNIYLVVEGNSTEPHVYRSWIPLVNPLLKEVPYIEDVTANNFLLRSGGGFPGIFKVIDAAIEDVSQNHCFDRLVVALDSDDDSYQTRYQTIDAYLVGKRPRVEYRIIIQHFCFETWALGNRKFGPRKPRDPVLNEYKTLHDVFNLDPEALPLNPNEDLNRAQFAFKYLHRMIRDKGPHLTYSKNRPDLVAHPSYFAQLHERYLTSGHIDSFGDFLNAFSE